MVLAIISTVVVANLLYDYLAISVPLFFVGIICADYDVSKIFGNMAIDIFALLCFLAVMFCFRSQMMVMHVFINIIALYIFLIACTRFRFEISYAPVILGDVSFGVYLTHNKVIKCCQYTIGLPPLWLFLLFVCITAFIYVYTKIMIINLNNYGKEKV